MPHDSIGYFGFFSYCYHFDRKYDFIHNHNSSNSKVHFTTFFKAVSADVNFEVVEMFYVQRLNYSYFWSEIIMAVVDRQDLDSRMRLVQLITLYEVVIHHVSCIYLLVMKMLVLAQEYRDYNHEHLNRVYIFLYSILCQLIWVRRNV